MGRTGDVINLPEADRMVHADGMEEMIVLDGEGNLTNREEILAVLKDV